MSAGELHYFKFVSALIDTGLWAKMSPAARTLYPVLLRFTDRHFKPVYPGTNALLKLTGFKQKSSLRRAREELQSLGLVHVERGSGRTNSTYYFLFERLSAPQRGDAAPRTDAPTDSPAERKESPDQQIQSPPRDSSSPPSYNQIHISIQNHPDSGNEPESRDWELARSECLLAGIPPSPENVQKILSRGKPDGSMAWNQILERLIGRVSPGSLELLRSCFLAEEGGWIRLQDTVPEYLKTILFQMHDQILFEPSDVQATERHRHWNQLI
ncbi:MAG: hypothetical protein KDK37_05130 [Leptospiraceae bacterium]|nr:hypothetical protein [Leptospiraceae bacterium]MCB1303633.1 hypothetical protein [Leptospiraceae bacterium]